MHITSHQVEIPRFRRVSLKTRRKGETRAIAGPGRAWRLLGEAPIRANWASLLTYFHAVFFQMSLSLDETRRNLEPIGAKVFLFLLIFHSIPFFAKSLPRFQSLPSNCPNWIWFSSANCAPFWYFTPAASLCLGSRYACLARQSKSI